MTPYVSVARPGWASGEDEMELLVRSVYVTVVITFRLGDEVLTIGVRAWAARARGRRGMVS